MLLRKPTRPLKLELQKKKKMKFMSMKVKKETKIMVTTMRMIIGTGIVKMKNFLRKNGMNG